uniref:Uncharacterized protein n=1 Tax=Myoviridae sp. ctqfO1 TaxID=2827710 RepID=A0A8S5T265_9CAUD|nr:MAG TPA: hypothetical protein [Myoviridae sp. ctqfO1]
MKVLFSLPLFSPETYFLSSPPMCYYLFSSLYVLFPPMTFPCCDLCYLSLYGCLFLSYLPPTGSLFIVAFPL